MDTDAYFRTRRAAPLDEVSFGYRTVRLFAPEALDEAQVGYRTTADGHDLTGTAEGDWRPEWLVVADEDEAGDPLFVDTSDAALPVYTARHGEGAWAPERVADTFGGFVAALGAVASVAVGREHPVGLEEHPLPEAERERTLRGIREANPSSSLRFWEEWLAEPEA